MSIDEIVTWTQFAIREPSHVAMGKRPRFNGVEILVPGDQVLCETSPKLTGVLNGLFVEFLVFLQSMDVRMGMMTLLCRRIELFRISGFEDDLANISNIKREIT
jgi:hypothetical protein